MQEHLAFQDANFEIFGSSTTAQLLATHNNIRDNNGAI